MTMIEEAKRMLAAPLCHASEPEWRRIVAGLVEEIEALRCPPARK